MSLLMVSSICNSSACPEEAVSRFGRCFPSSLNSFLKLTRFIRFGHNRPEPVSKLFFETRDVLEMQSRTPRERHEATEVNTDTESYEEPPIGIVPSF